MPLSDIRIGREFDHKRVLAEDYKTPARYAVTRIAYDTVYYRPVDGGNSESIGIYDFENRVLGSWVKSLTVAYKAQQLVDKAGHRYCVEEGRGRVPCNQPRMPQATSPSQLSRDDFHATTEEYASARKRAAAKIKNVPVPDAEHVAKMQAALQRAKADPKGRPGGDARGSAADRRRRAFNLFKEFGGLERGYVVCHGTGLKMHWTDDPKENPHHYPKFEQGKIFTACQGGGYQLPNLLPESFTYNRSRNDRPLRKENKCA